MSWQICIRYPNGQEKAICTYHKREIALKRVDALYSQGYSMHLAYVVRPIESFNATDSEDAMGCLQFL